MKQKTYLLLVTLLVILVNPYVAKTEDITLHKGVLDLTEWDFDKDGVFSVVGQSEFYFNQLLSPADFTNNKTLQPQYIDIPSIWSNGTIDGQTIPQHGYATYRIFVKLDYNKALNIKLDGVSTAYTVWIDGELLGNVGQVGSSKATSKPMYRIGNYLIEPNKNLATGETRTIEIIIQISNYHHTNSGLWDTIDIGSYESSLRLKTRTDFYNSLTLGILLIMALYHFSLYFLRRNDYSTLFFGLVSILMFIRGFTTDDRLILELFPNTSFFVLIRLEYLSVYTNIAFIAYFFYHLFNKEANKRFVQLAGVFAVLMSGIIIFAPVKIFTSFRDVYSLFALIVGFYVTFIVLIKAMIHKRHGSVIAFVGMFVFFGTGIFDVIKVVLVLPLPYIAQYGLVFYILSQSFILSQRFSISFIENKKLTETMDYQNKNLEKIVKERTSEVTQQSEEILAQQEEVLVINEELKKMNEELMQLTIVASKTDNAIAILDGKGNFEWTNKGFEKLFGHSLEELVKYRGQNFSETNINQNAKKAIAKCIEQKKTLIYENYITLNNGNNIWTHTTLTPIFDEAGNVNKIVAIDSDISKQKEAEKEITSQKDELESKNKRIAMQNKHIKASITYAKQIQKAILPQKKIFKKFDTFILFEPKDVVSGDFYWSSIVQNKAFETVDRSIRFLAVVDCTGHGVPGAFMSMIGSSLLNQIVNEKKIYSPKDILSHLHKNVQEALRQQETDNNDGMDVGICSVEILEDHTARVIFAGAKRPLIYCNKENQTLHVIQGDRKSIGGTKNYRNKVQFSNKEIILREGEKFYLSTDGFVDQNNSERKRFGTSKLIQLLDANKSKTMASQRDELLKKLHEWQKNEPQRDDITIIGVEI